MKSKLILIAVFTFSLLSCSSFSKEQKASVVNKFVSKSISINETKERLWSALTSEVELAKWWNKGVRLEPKIGGEFYEPWGDGQLATGKVLFVDPLKSIRFTWKEKTWTSKQQSVCEFFLEETDGVTILSVKHTGWESFGDSKEKMIEGFSKGWNFILPKLKSYIERSK